jgi:peptidyl-prolyl cis-trans isomerase B (cyclophilin B)
MEDGHSQRKSVVGFAVCMSVTIGVLVGGALGCGGGGDQPKASASTSGCKEVTVPKPKKVSYTAPKQTVSRGEKLTAVVETSCGTFDILLDTKRSPKTVNSFVFLSEKGFYDGLGFARAAPGTYLEGGETSGDAGGPGYSVQGEAPPPSFIYRQGVVAMLRPAEAPPGREGSGFFVVVAAPWIDLSGIYPSLGRIDGGFDVAERISKLGPPDPHPGTGNIGTVGQIGKLRRTVQIEGISIEKG